VGLTTRQIDINDNSNQASTGDGGNDDDETLLIVLVAVIVVVCCLFCVFFGLVWVRRRSKEKIDADNREPEVFVPMKAWGWDTEGEKLRRSSDASVQVGHLDLVFWEESQIPFPGAIHGPSQDDVSLSSQSNKTAFQDDCDVERMAVRPKPRQDIVGGETPFRGNRLSASARRELYAVPMAQPGLSPTGDGRFSRYSYIQLDPEAQEPDNEYLNVEPPPSPSRIISPSYGSRTNLPPSPSHWRAMEGGVHDGAVAVAGAPERPPPAEVLPMDAVTSDPLGAALVTNLDDDWDMTTEMGAEPRIGADVDVTAPSLLQENTPAPSGLSMRESLIMAAQQLTDSIDNLIGEAEQTTPPISFV